MSAVIVVPYRDDGGIRRRTWIYTQRFWEQLGLPVVLGDSPADEPFDITKARNEGVRGATERFPDWDVVLMVDADVVLGSPKQALHAIELARYGFIYVTAHSELRYLSEEGTRQVLEGLPFDRAARDAVHAETWESAFAFTHEIWVAVGGFDSRFSGFGHQVEAFFHAAKTLFGAGRQTGPCYHLWHPYSADIAPPNRENRALVERYWAATDNPALMREVIAQSN